MSHKYVRHAKTKDDSQDPSSDETFDCLFGRELDQLSTPEGDPAYVGEDVVGYDECGGEEEPDHSFEYVVHYEVCLDYD